MTRRMPATRVAAAAFILLVLASLGGIMLAQGQTVSAPPAPQAPGAPPQAAAPPEASARITGQVLAADTGAPVKRARVMAMGGTPSPRPPGADTGATAQLQVVTTGAGGEQPMPPGMARREAETNDAGRFELTALPAGRFTVSAQSPVGFLPPMPQTVELAAGGSASVSIRLDRAGAITGRVLDHEGDPLARAEVRALQHRSLSGARRLSLSGSGATTDDLGQFRLYGLPPGDYYVQASYMMPPSPPAATSAEPRLGYTRTLFPSAASLDGALKVSVRMGQDTVGIEVVLQRARMGTVAGRATDSAGTPLSPQRGYVSLSTASDGAPASGGFGARWQEDGTFVFQNVPPGRYVLSAMAAMKEAPNGSPREGAYRPLSVDGNDVVADIQTNLGATVSGRVVIEGTQPAPTTTLTGQTGAPRIRVSARPADPSGGSGGFSGGRDVVVAEDGTFQLIGLRGTLLLQAFAPRAALRSVVLGGEDIIATGLTLVGTERIDGVTIALTTDTGIIEGLVTTGNGDPVEAWVVVFPDDDARWFPMSPFVRVTRTRPLATGGSGGRGVLMPPVPSASSTSPSASSTSPIASAASRQPGGFMMLTLLPGRYAVVATEARSAADRGMPETDRESLEKMRASARMVSVVSGQTVTLQLQLKK